MSVSLREIKTVLQEIETKHRLPSNILTEIYDREKPVVFMAIRQHIDDQLRDIIIKKFNSLYAETNKNS